MATPGQGQSNKHPVGRLAAGESGVQHRPHAQPPPASRGTARKYSVDQLPEFLMQLRTDGVTNLGDWLNLHPAVSAKFGMVPIGLLHSPEVVTQQATFAPGCDLRLAHPSRLPDRERSSPARSSGTAPTARRQTFTAGQSFYETGAKHVRRQEPEHNGSRRRDGDLRRSRRHPDDRRCSIDEPQPSTCTQ